MLARDMLASKVEEKVSGYDRVIIARVDEDKVRMFVAIATGASSDRRFQA